MKPSLCSLLFLGLVSALIAPDPAHAQSIGCHMAPWDHGFADNHNLGRQVAMDSGRALVSAPGAGSVRAYARQGTNWSFVQELPDPAAGTNQFGAALALDGLRAFVGAPGSSASGIAAGAVYVYQWTSQGWTLETTLLDPSPTPGGLFGAALSAHNDWVVIGAPKDSGTGRVHVWDLSGAVPQFIGQYGQFQAQAEFGAAVAMHRPQGSSSAFLIIGDPATPTVGAHSGSAYFMRLHPFDGLVNMGSLPTMGLAGQHRFGNAVAYDGVTAVVGARGDNTVAAWAGAAYVYHAPAHVHPPTASLSAKLTFPGGKQWDRFGFAVAVEGHRIAIGAPQQPSAVQGDPAGPMGRVHVFERFSQGQPWFQRGVIEAPELGTGKRFGESVALSGGLILAGAPNDSEHANASGRVWLSSITNTLDGGLCPTPHLTTATHYGTGKPGSKGVPQLNVGLPPVPGSLTVISLSGLTVGTKPVLLAGVEPAALPFDGGWLWVANPQFLWMPTAGPFGQVGIGWNVPNDPAITGQPLFLQAMALEAGVPGPFGTIQSRGLFLSPGY